MKPATNIVLLAVTAFPVCILMHEITHLLFGLVFGTKIVDFCFGLLRVFRYQLHGKRL